MAAKASGVVRHIASAVCHSSYDHLREAYRLFNTIPPGEVELQRLGGQCGIDLFDTARLVLQDNDEVLSLARDVERKCAALSDSIIHGRSLVLLGAVLKNARRWQEALSYLDQARTMLKAAGNTYSLAEANQITSWVHYDQGRLPEALDAIEEAWNHAQLTENVSIQADIFLSFGKVLFSDNKDAEARKYIEISLMKASYIGKRFTVACALEYMGYGYLRRGDYQHVYGAYEAAAEKYIGTVDADTNRDMCKDNISRLKVKEENIDMVIGFHRHGLDVDRTLFYLPVQASASVSGS
jgi:tetratricopeptide (TPR) repeat protein